MSAILSTRRRFLGQAAAVGLTGAAWPVWAQDQQQAAPPAAAVAPDDKAPAAADTLPPPDQQPEPPPEETTASLPLAGGPRDRPITKDFPQKGPMVLQSTRPPVLETPFDVFDKGVITPNNRFYVDWEAGSPPPMVNPATFRLTVRGNVVRPVSLSLDDLVHGDFKKVEITAVDQAAGNSRGLFQPRVPGIQWGNGAMGNAKWTGVRLSDILDGVGVKPGTVQARFSGMDQPVQGAPKLMMSLNFAHARDGDVIVAYAMNGAPLPLLNGFPLRLVVPGYYGCYWIKMLNDIELLTQPDDNYWMTTGYAVPASLHADVTPGSTSYTPVPVGRMAPRAFITNIRQGEKLVPDTPTVARGLAMGGDNAVARVDFSADGGQSWKSAKLGKDSGKYGFRQWEASFKLPAGGQTLMVRCTNLGGATQFEAGNWNPAGLARDAVESVDVMVTAGDDDAAQ
jgi:DMSO/TMAO reductase YedYZ molybdopterin-dependent catalytic subunit